MHGSRYTRPFTIVVLNLRFGISGGFIAAMLPFVLMRAGAWVGVMMDVVR